MSVIDDVRKQYMGKYATLNGKPARIHSVEGGRGASVVSSGESGEASWFKIKEVMTKKGGRFILSRGHLAI